MGNNGFAQADHKKILVVDDDRPIRKLVKRSLAEEGYIISDAVDGQDAVERLNQDLFDLVISDIAMPKMDGIELVRWIVAYASMDVIVMTGYIADYRYEELIKLGAADFIHKPFTSDEIKVRVNRVFRERQLQEETDRLQRQASQSQKLESLGQISMGIAHEIKSPLQFVGDNIDFVKDAFVQIDSALSQLLNAFDADMPGAVLPDGMKSITSGVDWEELAYSREELPKALNQAGEGLQRIGEIIKAVKGFSHPGRQEEEDASLIKCLRDAAVISKHEWKSVAKISWDMDDNLPDIRCNPGELIQAFINIIINAAHAISEKSSQGNTEMGTISIQVKQGEKDIEIQISDTGTGIPEKVIPRIYEPFFTTKDVGKGTGQGLAITHSIIVERHHGRIEVETRESRGTRFIITLPV